MTSSNGITLYFLTYQVDCNEIILLRVFMALYFISLHVRRIATNLRYLEYSWHYKFLKSCQEDFNEIVLSRVVMALAFISVHLRWIAT